jgi:transcription antitermination factor NusG
MDNPRINNTIKRWYALYTKPRHEFKARTELSEIGIEYYLPTITTIKQWSDRKKKVTEPLFRGYVFVYVNEKERHNALNAQSIVKTICFDGKPEPIPDWEIENLKLLMERSPNVLVTDRIEIGTTVRITNGPFEGLEGKVYKSANNAQMLAVTIELLNRSVSVELPSTSVTKKIEQKAPKTY